MKSFFLSLRACTRHWLTTGALLLCLGSWAHATDRLYYLSSGGSGTTPAVTDTLRVINSDGTGDANVFNANSVANPNALALDITNNRAFVADSFNGLQKIYAVNLTTGAVSSFLDLTGAPYTVNAMEVDPINGKLYYLSGGGAGSTPAATDTLRRVNLDGTGDASVFAANSLANPNALALDLANNRAFVADSFAGLQKIYAVNLSTGAVSVFLDVTAAPYTIVAMEVDPIHGKLYYLSGGGSGSTPAATDTLRVINLDGTGDTSVFSANSVANPNALALDLNGNRAFVADSFNGLQKIYVVSLASGAVSSFLDATAAPYTINAMRMIPTAPVITSPLAASGTYGTPIATYTITATNFPTTFGATGLPPGLSVNPFNGQITGTPTSTTGSPYSVTISATNAGGTTSATLVFSIAKATLTVSANNAARAYFAADPAFTATLTGFVNGDTSAVVSGAPSFTTDAVATSPVGSYTITPALGTLAATNYVFTTFNPGVLTITPVPLTVSAVAASRTYGAADPAFTATITGFVNSETTAVVSGSPGFVTNATVTSPAGGSYTITPTLGTLSATNYSFTTFNSAPYVITKALLNVAANNASRAYGAADPAFSATYTGFLNGDTAAVLSGAPAFTTNATATSAVGGAYTITPSVGTLSAVSYDFTFSSGTLAITPAPLIVTANPASRTYGAADPAFTVTFTGFANGETSAVLSGSPSFTTNATATSAAGGSYQITPALGTLSATNYSFASFVDGPLTITKAPLTVTADDASRLYGAANPVFTATFAGFVNGESLATSGITGSAALSTTATPASAVGTYAITAGVGTLTANNYSFTFVDGTLTIGTATLTVAADNQSRTYGAANPSLTYSLGGFVNGETLATSGVTGTPALATTATATSSPGGYPITITTGTLAATNYSFTFTPGTLTISKAALAVTANNASKVYGAANPAFTATFTGFVNGETLGTSDVSGAVAFTTPATAASGVGTYAITPAAGTLASANYSFGPFVAGTLTVTPASLIVKADDASRLFGVANPTFTATFIGFVNGDTAATAFTGAPSLTTAATIASPVGTYPITAAPGTLASTNYTFTSFLNGTLTITPAVTPATVALSDLVQAYDGTPKSATATTTPTGLTVALTYDGNPTAPTLPGSYAVVATITSPGYTGSATGTLTITVTAIVRHGPTLNGDIDGSLQVLLPESFTLNGGSMVSSDILVPGTPNVQLNGSPTFAGVQDSTGTATPSNYTITLNGNTVVRHVVRRVNAIAMPVVSAPGNPAGTRNVTLNNASDSPGDFATLRNLTLNGNAGSRAVPAGTYGNFTANGNGGFVLGTVGATTPSVYEFQQLTLNGNATLQVVGPVILRLRNSVSFNGAVGSAAEPGWLAIEIYAGGLTLNGSATLYGSVTAPNGTVIVNAALHGNVSADRLTINGNGLVSEIAP